MKTVTEFSGSTLKQAAAAKAKLLGEGVAPEQLSERLGTEVSITGDRLARLVEALEAAGDQVERVRLMRVFAATDEPKGAKKIGEFNYLIDLQPSSAPQGRDRGGRGGRDRDRGRGGGPGRGAPGGAGGGPGKGPLGRDGLPREDRGPLQTAGAGWTLTRDPSAPLHDKRRGGPKRGKPGDRRGPGGERRGPRPGRPGEQRAGGPGGAPGAPGGERGFRGPRPDRPRGPRPPGAPGAPGPGGGPGGPRPEGQAAEAGGPEAQRRRRRRRGRGGPFALQPSTAPGAAAALGIPSAATTGVDPNAPPPSAGPPGMPGVPGAPGQKKRRRRRGGRGRGQGPRPPMTGAPTPGGAPGEPANLATSPENAGNAEASGNVRPEPNGNLRVPEPPPPTVDNDAPEPGNER